jgi:NADP-dependent 3-hydroxy acid dehydrogenase YdfG
MLTRLLRGGLGPKMVRVAIIEPGSVDTELPTSTPHTSVTTECETGPLAGQTHSNRLLDQWRGHLRADAGT